MIRTLEAAPVARGEAVASGLGPIERDWFEALAEFDEPAIIEREMRKVNNARADARALRR